MIGLFLAFTVKFVWTPVKTDTDGNPISIAYYNIYRRSVYASAYPAAPLTRRYNNSYSATISAVVDYRYKVTAVSTEGVESDPSVEGWVTSEPILKSGGPIITVPAQ